MLDGDRTVNYSVTFLSPSVTLKASKQYTAFSFCCSLLKIAQKQQSSVTSSPFCHQFCHHFID